MTALGVVFLAISTLAGVGGLVISWLTHQRQNRESARSQKIEEHRRRIEVEVDVRHTWVPGPHALDNLRYQPVIVATNVSPERAVWIETIGVRSAAGDRGFEQPPDDPGGTAVELKAGQPTSLTVPADAARELELEEGFLAYASVTGRSSYFHKQINRPPPHPSRMF